MPKAIGPGRFAAEARRAAAVCAAVVLCACASPGPEPFQAVTAQRARLVAQNPAGRVRFEGIFARDAQGNAALDLYKGGVEPVGALRLGGDGRASFHLRGAGRSWRGPRDQAPNSIAPLLEILALYQRESGLEEGEREIRSPAGHAAVEVRGGRLRSAAVAGAEGYAALAIFTPPR